MSEEVYYYSMDLRIDEPSKTIWKAVFIDDVTVLDDCIWAEREDDKGEISGDSYRNEYTMEDWIEELSGAPDLRFITEDEVFLEML